MAATSYIVSSHFWKGGTTYERVADSNSRSRISDFRVILFNAPRRNETSNDTRSLNFVEDHIIGWTSPLWEGPFSCTHLENRMDKTLHEGYSKQCSYNFQDDLYHL